MKPRYWFSAQDVVALTTLLVVFLFVFAGSLKHRTEVGAMKSLVGRIQRCDPAHVVRIRILTGYKVAAVLESPKDQADINRLFASLKNIRVAEREHRANGDSEIHIDLDQRLTKDPGMIIYCDIDPDHAPYISPAMRSDDLGLTVQSILKKHKKGYSK